MALWKISIFMTAMTMALTIAITMHAIINVEQKPSLPANEVPEEKPASIQLPSKKVSRFLANTPSANPRAAAADQCNKDNEICNILGGAGYKCCNNKCMDLTTDRNNCGACKNKCKFTQACCRGQCVNLSFDKRHCGRCNNRCPAGDYCVYGLCEYA